MNPSVDWHLVFGKPLSGKTTVASIMAKSLGFKLIDYKVFEEKVRKAKSTEEEPFEGDLTVEDVATSIENFINEEMNAGKKHVYIIDGLWTQEGN